MNRQAADVLVGTVLVGLVALGGPAAWQAYQHARMMGGMMGGMGGLAGLTPVWYLFGTALGVVAIGGGYALVRGSITESTEEPVVEQPEGDKPSGTEPVREKSVPRLLDALPEDERRLLEPVIDSPGLTQIELRDRASFSKAKVSQTVSDLEQRGLLYRERQGRTYRVYPDEHIADDPP